MKQTAVEWLVNRWKKLQSEQEKMTWNQIIQITELAKEMEKEQIIDAYCIGYFDAWDNPTYKEVQRPESAGQYYKETYGGNK